MIETLGQWILVGIFFTAYGMWCGWHLRGIWISSFLDPEVRNAEEKKITDLRETVGVTEDPNVPHIPKFSWEPKWLLRLMKNFWQLFLRKSK